MLSVGLRWIVGRVGLVDVEEEEERISYAFLDPLERQLQALVTRALELGNGLHPGAFVGIVIRVEELAQTRLASENVGGDRRSRLVAVLREQPGQRGESF